MTTFTAFKDGRIIATGDMAAMIAAQRKVSPRGVNLLIYENATGTVRDVDLRDVPPPARGRPKLGVKAREVTLLPRHWEWLGQQRGGASAALRRLVEAASKVDTPAGPAGQNAAYAFLASIAGDFPGYEEAIRCVFANDHAGFHSQTAEWPADVRGFADQLWTGTPWPAARPSR